MLRSAFRWPFQTDTQALTSPLKVRDPRGHVGRDSASPFEKVWLCAAQPKKAPRPPWSRVVVFCTSFFICRNDTLAKIQGIVDPQNKHSLQKLLATMTWLGLKPEDWADLDPSKDEEVEVSHKVPDAEKARKIGNERSEVWEGLKRARLTEVQKRLQFLSDDDARRVLKVKLGEGVRPVLEEDLPPVECLDGMADFEAMRDKAFQKIKDPITADEQQRKAALLASGFLMEKKRLDEADQKIAALEQRLKEYKKAQADAIAERKKENEKAQDAETLISLLRMHCVHPLVVR
eukprot:g13620.t1